MLSLFDYLGAAAGGELGKQVSEYAKIKKIKPGFRDVSNPKYKGLVLLYDRAFLDEFFKVRALFVK